MVGILAPTRTPFWLQLETDNHRRRLINPPKQASRRPLPREPPRLASLSLRTRPIPTARSHLTAGTSETGRDPICLLCRTHIRLLELSLLALLSLIIWARARRPRS